MRISDWSSDLCSSDLPGLAESPPCNNQPRPPVSIRGKLLRTRPKGPVPLQQRIIPDLGIDDRRPLLRPQSAKLPRQLQRRHAASPSGAGRSEEHTSELQSLMRISYAVFCLKKKNQQTNIVTTVSVICESTTSQNIIK